tara:strand:- start:1279 stop:1566 length:288 start_codon:yes stop_codon:yes gene_type:complete
MTIVTGSRVKIKDISPPGHIRTPKYIRGKNGVIERFLGVFKNPEQLAYSLQAKEYGLYRVRFKMTELWDDYSEHPNDTLDAEVFAHWIEEIKNAT